MWFGDHVGFSLPFLEVSVNRNDCGGRRLQFSAPGRNIERVSASEPIVMISRLVAMSSGSSLTKQSGGGFRMSHIYLKMPALIDRFELRSIRLWIPIIVHQADRPLNS